MKRFMAIWEVLQNFREIFKTGLWMLIPAINLFVVIGHMYNHVSEIARDYFYRLGENFQQGRDSPFYQTKPYWSKVITQTLIGVGYAFAAIAVNYYAFTYAADYKPLILDYVTVLYVAIAGYVALAIVCLIGIRVVVDMVHAIYKAHMQYHPDYNDCLPSSYLKNRQLAIDKRNGVLTETDRIISVNMRPSGGRSIE